MAQQLIEASMVWRDIPIQVRLTRFWLAGHAHHIELKAMEPLPITETGYRSCFVDPDPDMQMADVLEMLRVWLDERAGSKEWLRKVKQARQGDLFDL